MTKPAFQEPHSSADTEGSEGPRSKRFRMTREQRAKMFKSFQDNGIPDTPETRAHALEAEELVKELEARQIAYERISPTRNGDGHVRMNFTAMWDLLDKIDERDDL